MWVTFRSDIADFLPLEVEIIQVINPYKLIEAANKNGKFSEECLQGGLSK